MDSAPQSERHLGQKTGGGLSKSGLAPMEGPPPDDHLSDGKRGGENFNLTSTRCPKNLLHCGSFRWMLNSVPTSALQRFNEAARVSVYPRRRHHALRNL